MKRYLPIFASLILAGCSSSELEQPVSRSLTVAQQPPKVDYATPIDRPARVTPFTVEGSVPEVVDRVVAAFGRSGFTIDHVNRDLGIVTATFRADPEDYVDCGELSLSRGDGEVLKLPAAAGRMRYDIPLDDGASIGTIDRMMVLDGRAVVAVERAGFSLASVNISGDYVLTRLAVLREKGSDEARKRKQYLAFGTGQAVGFDKGSTICQSNGRLENDLLTIDALR